MTDVAAPVTVVGGSVIGLACAHRLARAGHAVEVVDPFDPGTGTAPGTGAATGTAPAPAAWVAAGMLGAYTEAWPGDEDLLHQGVTALAAWRRLRAELGEEWEGRPVFHDGTVLLGVDDADAADVGRVADLLDRETPGAVTRLTRRELRDREPSLRRGVRAAVACDAEFAVDNRRVLAALAARCRDLGVRFTRRTVASLGEVTTPVVVLAAGHAAGDLLPALRPLLRPVKGEVVRLRRRAGSLPGPTRTVRARVHGRALYVVPRWDGCVVGATEYEHGVDREPTAGGVRQLLDDAAELVPGLDDHEFTEVIAGLRPYSPDNLPLVGTWTGPVPAPWPDGADRHLVVAVGHGRNGVLHSAVTGEIVAAVVGGRPLTGELAAAAHRVRPGRYDGAHDDLHGRQR
ncbi:FAD-dependent oxidoreductase [Corynebacterium bovis]|uniref:FAD-dependent oxidoreductase n=1 Tax=Corynebacterium bovis TaxID=36808 RepID=UPI003138F99A